MGSIDVNTQRMTLAEVVGPANLIVHARVASPRTVRGPLGALERYDVVEVLRAYEPWDGPAFTPQTLEVEPADAWVQRALAEHPYSHPVQTDVVVEPAPGERESRVGPDDAELLLVLQVTEIDGRPARFEHVWGVRLPVGRKAEVERLLAMPPAPPTPAIPGWPQRLWARLTGRRA